MADKSTEKSGVYLPLCLVSLVRIGRKSSSLFDYYRKTCLRAKKTPGTLPDLFRSYIFSFVIGNDAGLGTVRDAELDHQFFLPPKL